MVGLYSKAHYNLRVRHETFFLSVMLLDDVIKIRNSDDNEITLVDSMVCFFLAAKF